MREQWDSRTAFVLAAIGSAIGLGNVWRFPYICFKYGGGAFLIPYFVALLTAGIPLMILEFSLGHKMASGAPTSFAKAGRGKEWIGWFALLVAFGIVSYYAVIMGWCFNYFGYSFNLSWGDATKDFFYNKFLTISEGPFKFGGIKPFIMLTLFISWIAIVGCVWRGPKTVSKVVYVTVLLPWLILIIFVIRGLTLPGAVKGLSYYLTPNFAALRDIEVWRNAYGQVFYSLSIGFGIMIAYASYLPKKSDIVSNALIISLADAGTAFFAGLAVFSTLGYYSYTQGVAVPDVVEKSIGLAFIVYPTIINLLPFAGKLFGALFFLMLLTLAIDSAFSLMEAGMAGIMDKWKVKKRWAINIGFGAIAFFAGIIYTTRAGLYWIDIVDHFMQNFGLMTVVLVECIFLGYMFKLSVLKEHCNALSDIRVGKWWDICIKFITPLVLILLLVFLIIEKIKGAYGGYSRGAEFLGGWLILIVFFIISIVLMKVRSRK
ncbi:sodium-dependent transporter [candidate division WOR-3 bacterium]|nr:sodium-dependent transporter [candidate division WOR-3 bacterium]